MLAPDRNLYTINIATGTVLLNGVPPSRLPQTILAHPLYQRSFRDRNFEVGPCGPGLSRSIETKSYLLLHEWVEILIPPIPPLECQARPRNRGSCPVCPILA